MGRHCIVFMFNTGGYYGCGGCPVGEDTVLSSCSILVEWWLLWLRRLSSRGRHCIVFMFNTGGVVATMVAEAIQ